MFFVYEVIAGEDICSGLENENGGTLPIPPLVSDSEYTFGD
jgi:hypothetical protein